MTDRINLDGWRRFFMVAAVFNFTIAASLLFYRPLLYQMLHIDPNTATGESIYIIMFALLVALFGAAYWRIALNLRDHRDLLWMGIWGKTLVFSGAWYATLASGTHLGLAMVTVADLLFAAIFAYFLYRILPTLKQ